VEAGALRKVVPNQNLKKYRLQNIMVVEVAGYAFLLPFVEEDDHFFLKTIIPGRKATRDFIATESEGAHGRGAQQRLSATGRRTSDALRTASRVGIRFHTRSQ